MKHKFIMVFIAVLVLSSSFLFGAAGDYRTKATGNWNALSTWERHDGTNWAEPTALQGTPTNSSGTITIQSPHTVTVTANVAADQITVDSGGQITINSGITFTVANGPTAVDMSVTGTVKSAGTITTTGALTFNNGSKYQHNWAAALVGSIPTATWSDGSTCEIINMTGTGATTKLKGANQSFYDFVWNTTGQSQAVYIPGTSFRPVRHDFIMKSTGSSLLEVSGVEGIDPANARLEFTNYKHEGGTFQIKRTGMNVPYAMNVAGDFTMSGGTLQGIATGTNSTLNFTKSGTQTFSKTGGTISGGINYVVKTGSTLDVGTSVLTSSGTFTLQSGAGLITKNTAGITSSGATGSIQVSGTRTYNSGANYTFNGTSAQATGNGLSTANNIVINNSAGVTFTNSITVNGTLTQTSGAVSGTQAVDGYSSVGLNYVSFPETGNNISNFSMGMTTNALLPTYVDRQWNISGTYTGDKVVTFYWTDTDDGGFDWSTNPPAVFKGLTKYSADAMDYSGATNWVTVTVPNSLTKGEYTIGKENEILPVELSSFTAVLSSENLVTVKWITQSETGVGGYYVYRANDSNWANAMAICDMIDSANSPIQQVYQYTDTNLVEDGTYYYWLQVQDLNGITINHGPTSIYYSSGSGPETPEVVQIYGIKSIHPNPITPYSMIDYNLSKQADVSFKIYNSRGQLINSFSDGNKIVGNHSIAWDGTDFSGKPCPNGVYFIKMSAGRDSGIRKVMIVR